MGNVVAGWDLSTGRAGAFLADSRPKEIALVQAGDPRLGISSMPAASGSFQIEIWGLDDRTRLEAEIFYRKAAWLDPMRAAGAFDTGHQLTGVEGEQFTATIDDRAITLDSDGAVHVLGDVGSGDWRNGTSVPNGIEFKTGTEGIRLLVNWAVGLPPSLDSWLCWDLCLKLYVKPSIKFGCDGVAEAVQARFRVTGLPDSPKLLYIGLAG